MVKSLTIWMPGEPPRSTAQQQLITRSGRVVPGKKVTAAKQVLEGRLAAHVPAEPFTGPLAVAMVWCWSRSGKMPIAWKTTRPDIDNIAKLLLDAMTRLRYWEDDATVAQLSVTKIWNPEPGIKITIRKLEKIVLEKTPELWYT